MGFDVAHFNEKYLTVVFKVNQSSKLLLDIIYDSCETESHYAQTTSLIIKALFQDHKFRMRTEAFLVSLPHTLCYRTGSLFDVNAKPERF